MPVARAWALLLLAATSGEAVDYVNRQVRTAEEHHYRLQHFWQLGEGFEGSASDWTEYVVWLVGVIAFLFYIGNPNARRNVHAQSEHVWEEGEEHNGAPPPAPPGEQDQGRASATISRKSKAGPRGGVHEE